MMQSPKDKLVESNCSCCCCWGVESDDTRAETLLDYTTTDQPASKTPADYGALAVKWRQTFAEWSTTGGENEDL